MTRRTAALALALWGSCALAGSPAKVVLIGLDGASWNVLDPLIEQGATPNLAKLAQSGARGELASFWPLRTPQVWTSVVTGKLPGQHGIWDHDASSPLVPPPYRTPKRHLLTSRDRKSKALWVLLGERGIRTLVVGWISSWPAEEVPNATIAAPAARTDTAQATIKGSFWRDMPGQVSPEKLWPRAKTLIVAPKDVTPRQLTFFADVPPADSPLRELPLLERYLRTLRWSVARAESVEALTLGLYDTARPDVVLAYFQCGDSLGHRFWAFREGVDRTRAALRVLNRPERHAANLVARFGRVVDACWRDLDARVGRLLEVARGPETLVLVVSDHGFGPTAGPNPDAEEPFGGDHRAQGLIIAAGPSVKASPVKGASVLDVTPTVLYALGLPYAKDMRGKVFTPLFAPELVQAHPVEQVETFEAAPQLEAPFAEGYPSRAERPHATSR